MTTITLPRATVEQALEALEHENTMVNRGDGHWEFTHDLAAAALRAALAEPVQEPVAWMVYTEGGTSAYVTDNPNDLVGAYRALALYTAPPQRKPLTDDEIPALAEKAWKPSVYCDAEALLGTDGLVALVRAVEAKHGIKERP